MAFEGSAVAISHTGKVRSNNQDSGYAGSNLFVVADGMGGHAGGDVASALAIARLQELDQAFPSTQSAERALRAAIHETAGDLISMTKRRPELTGMASRSTRSSWSMTTPSSVTSVTRASTPGATTSSPRSPPTTPSCSAWSIPDASPPTRRATIRAAPC